MDGGITRIMLHLNLEVTQWQFNVRDGKSIFESTQKKYVAKKLKWHPMWQQHQGNVKAMVALCQIHDNSTLKLQNFKI